MDPSQQNIQNQRKINNQSGKRSAKISKNQSQQNLVGPNPRKIQKKQYHDLVLQSLPSSQYYEISYMHKDIVSYILVSPINDLIITVSVDGHIKFWQKIFNLIALIKTIKAHNGVVNGVCLSKNHDLLASIGIDKMLRIFDVQACQLRVGIKLSFIPICCDFFPPKPGYDTPLIILGQQKSPKMIIIDYQKHQQIRNIEDEQNMLFGQDNQTKKIDQADTQIKKIIKDEQTKGNSYIQKTLNIHKHPIKFIKMNWKYNVCISIDERSFLQIWNPETFDIPKNLSYNHKMQTNYWELIKANSIPISMTLSSKQNLLAVMLKDMIIRIYNILTGKIYTIINQSIKQITKIQENIQHQSHQLYSLDHQSFQKKINLEKDIQLSKESQYNFGIQFDEAQQYLVYTSTIGVVFYSLSKNYREFVLGKKEHQRFLKCVLYQGRVMRNPAGSSTTQGQRKAADPLLICTSFKRPRFYIFSKRQPEFQQNAPVILRDVINERTAKQQAQMHNAPKQTQTVGNQVVLNTTHGDIQLYLYTEDCPKTCQNFIKLIKKNYYDGMVFHRVINGFMNQTGCPKGDGTGGQSIWGGNFKDQIVLQKHRFEKPYCLAMANRGPDTNGSQFFITVVACPWLDGKHTIFGRVTKGIQTVLDINKIKTDKNDKPLITVKILSARVI